MSRSHSRIPREVDDLIWKLTEDGTPAAFDQFRARYPEYSKTLSDRLQMVDRLKGSRPSTEKIVAPKFRPSARVEGVRPFWSPAAIAMVGIAFAAVVVTVVLYLPRTPSPKPKFNRETPPVAKGFIPNQVGSTETPTVTNNRPPDREQIRQPNPNQDLGEAMTPAYLTPQSLAIRNAKLSLVVQAIAQQGKFAVNIGPGLADPVISVDYRGLNSIEILQDLGRQYAFTPFDQGDGTVIIVPARDPNDQGSDKSVAPSPTPASTSEPKPGISG